MCKLRDERKIQDHHEALGNSRRDFLKASTAGAVAAAGMNFLTAPAAAAPGGDPGPPVGAGERAPTLFAPPPSCRWTRPSATSPKATSWSKAGKSSPSEKICKCTGR